MERQIPITIVTTTPSDNDEYSIILGNILILWVWRSQTL